MSTFNIVGHDCLTSRNRPGWRPVPRLHGVEKRSTRLLTCLCAIGPLATIPERLASQTKVCASDVCKHSASINALMTDQIVCACASRKRRPFGCPRYAADEEPSAGLCECGALWKHG